MSNAPSSAGRRGDGEVTREPHRQAARNAEKVSQVAPADPLTPADRYQELFVAVQTARIFADSKTFVDCAPLQRPEAILAAYRAQCDSPGFDLAAFVHAHFRPERPPESCYVSDPEQTLVAHIDGLWDVLTRHPREHPTHSSLLPLPEQYVVPGGRFGEMYYWDSYFTMLGLVESGRADLMQSMADNFAYLIDTYGHVPNGNRSYYLSRSQPPVFSLMVALFERHRLCEALHYLPRLRREHAFWMTDADDLRAAMRAGIACAWTTPACSTATGTSAPRHARKCTWRTSWRPGAVRATPPRCTATCARPRHRAGISARAGSTTRAICRTRARRRSFRSTSIASCTRWRRRSRGWESAAAKLPSRAGSPGARASVPPRSGAGSGTRHPVRSAITTCCADAVVLRARRRAQPCMSAWPAKRRRDGSGNSSASGCSTTAASPPRERAAVNSGTSPTAGRRCNGWRSRAWPATGRNRCRAKSRGAGWPPSAGCTNAKASLSKSTSCTRRRKARAAGTAANIHCRTASAGPTA